VPAVAKNKGLKNNKYEKKATEVSNGNNVSLPGYSKWEQYNGGVVTGRSGM